MGRYILDLETTGKVKKGQAVYGLPDGKFYTVEKSRVKGIPLGYIIDITDKGILIEVKGGQYLLSVNSEKLEPVKIKNRFQILKEN
jgi:hypothetical protein